MPNGTCLTQSMPNVLSFYGRSRLSDEVFWGGHKLEAPSPEPRVTIQLPEAGHVHLVLRFPAPDHGRSRVEQAILLRYLVSVC